MSLLKTLKQDVKVGASWKRETGKGRVDSAGLAVSKFAERAWERRKIVFPGGAFVSSQAPENNLWLSACLGR
jgi:hypothetical protein